MVHVLEMPMLDDSLASARKWKVLNIHVPQLFMKLYSRWRKESVRIIWI